jgi:hypothetical protein
MNPIATLFRKSLFLLCSAASWSVLSCNASAQRPAPLTECVGVSCNDSTTWTIPYVRQSLMITNDQLNSALAANSLANHLEKIFSEFFTSDSEAYAAARKRLDGIMRHAESESAEMVGAMPDMYVSMLGTQAAQTSEGKPFVLVN